MGCSCARRKPLSALVFIGLLASLLGCARELAPAGRALVIGVDGATNIVLAPMIAAGELPNLQAIARQGISTSLRPDGPLLSPRIWTSIATGRSPERHGIEGWVRLDETGRPRLYTSADRKVHAIWNMLSDAGSVRWADPVRVHERAEPRAQLVAQRRFSDVFFGLSVLAIDPSAGCGNVLRLEPTVRIRYDFGVDRVHDIAARRFGRCRIIKRARDRPEGRAPNHLAPCAPSLQCHHHHRRTPSSFAWMKLSTCSSNTGIGTGPFKSTTSWNSRGSNCAPSLSVARARELANLELAHLVGERLAWPGNIAVRLGRDFVDGKCRPRREIVDRLLPSRLEGLESHDRGLWKGKGNLAVNVTV